MAADYRCSMCDEVFSSGQDLEKHNGMMHATAEMGGTDKAYEGSERPAGDMPAKVTAEAGEASFVCDRCGSVYESRAALAEHASAAAHAAA